MFLQSLAETNKNVAFLSLFQEYQERFVSKQPETSKPKLPPSLRTLYDESLSDEMPDIIETSCEKVYNTITYDIEQLLLVEETTRNQGKSLTWYQQRIGRITGSVAHQAASNPSPAFIKRICQSQRQTISNNALKWGRDKEDEAFSDYKSVMLKKRPGQS